MQSLMLILAWSSLLDLNIIGNLLSIKHAAIKMKASGGSIISISSIEGAAPSKFMGPYSVSIGAEMLVKNAALELGPFGIRVAVFALAWYRPKLLLHRYHKACKIIT